MRTCPPTAFRAFAAAKSPDAVFVVGAAANPAAFCAIDVGVLVNKVTEVEVEVGCSKEVARAT